MVAVRFVPPRGLDVSELDDPGTTPDVIAAGPSRRALPGVARRTRHVADHGAEERGPHPGLVLGAAGDRMAGEDRVERA